MRLKKRVELLEMCSISDYRISMSTPRKGPAFGNGDITLAKLVPLLLDKLNLELLQDLTTGLFKLEKKGGD